MISAKDLLTLIISAWPFTIWRIDIVGKLPLVRGNLKYVVVIVDYFTKYVEAKALSTITADKIIRFVYHTIFCHYGVLTKIVSNNGTQFNNAKFRKFCDDHKVQKRFLVVVRP